MGGGIHPTTTVDVMTPLIAENMSVDDKLGEPLGAAPPPFPSALRSGPAGGQPRVPQAIAHRGFKARNPENTMRSFKDAIRVGAHGLETDIHLSKDGVVVLSHDPTLKRCFGVDKKVIDCDWKYLSSLRTVQAPHEPMPALVDLLRYLALPEQSNIWLLLDIKIDNDAAKVMSGIADAIRSVQSLGRPWHERVVLGVWTSDYLPLCDTYLPSYPISLITFSIAYARHFLRVPNISINMNQRVLMGPCGRKFLADAKRAGRAVFVWTVNNECLMRWSIERGVDAVLTDDPELFLRVCDEWELERATLNASGQTRRMRKTRIPLSERAVSFTVSILAYVITAVFMFIHRARIRRFILDSRYYQSEPA